MIEAKVIATGGSKIVGLRGVGLGVVFGKGDAFSFQVGKVGVFDDLGKVLLGEVRSVERSSRGTARRRRTWFSSQMVMNLSKDLPPGASLNFSPVPSAEAHSQQVRVKNSKGEKDFMAL